LYFSDDENEFIDRLRRNISLLENETDRAIAKSSLIRACMKKRARGIFTYVGPRYNDGRQDLKTSLTDHFVEATELFNAAVFGNGKKNITSRRDALSVRPVDNSLVYIDPPYFSKHSDNEYVRRYHFVEGLACDWDGVEIQENTITKKFKSYPTPFSTRDGTHKAFQILFEKHRDSILLVSYSSNSLPTQDEIIELMSRYKSTVEVVPIEHRYSFGNQRDKITDNRNSVQEYLFIGY
jgi:DNA adenine methylase